MRFFLIIILLIAAGCALQKKSSSKHSPKRASRATLAEDKDLKKLLDKKFSRKGKYSTVTDGNVTMEKYRRDDGETVLTLENEELRTETLIEKGRTITRTWQNDEITNLTVASPQKTTMVSLDRDRKFIHKIITRKGKKKPICVWYEKEMAIVEEDDTCVETLSGFE